jgi:hypothetical protein
MQKGISAGRAFVSLGWCALAFASLIVHAQDETEADVLRHGQIVAGNIQTAIVGHLTEDPNFQRNKQLPEDRQNEPKLLYLKDGSFAFDWTPGQEARYLMEELRQGLHILQAVDKPKGFDIIALRGARDYWPKLRDISCRESPGIRYYDLDGFEQFCPIKETGSKPSQ